jgi:hypothetical protein
VGAGQHGSRTVNTKTGGILLGASTAGLSTVAVRAGHVNEDEGGLLVKRKGGQNMRRRNTDVLTVC